MSTEKTTARPRLGNLLKKRAEDSLRDYPADGLTPSRLATILRAADEGQLGEALQLYEQMEEKDAHLYSIANMRRLAVTGLEWKVVSAAENQPVGDGALAVEAAAYCQEVLAGMDGFEEALQHLSLAVGRNIAVAELVWEAMEGGHRLAAVVPVDFGRLVFDELDQLRILTEEEPQEGIAPPANKFVVHTPHSVSGHPSRGGLLRVTAMAYLAKHYTLKDWLTFMEVFGMPIRIARYEASASAEEKQELLNMLRNMGHEAAGVFSKAVELEIVEANRGTPVPPYESLVSFVNREMSKAWLGQTLTVEMGGEGGAKAAAEVHDRVRLDIRQDDIRKEARTIRREMLRPMVELRYGRGTPAPYFQRQQNPVGDRRELAEVLSIARNELGVGMTEEWVRTKLGIAVR